MSELFIVGRYDRAAKTISTLQFVMPIEEEQRQHYVEETIIYVGKRVYKLRNRQLSNNEIVHYDLEVIKE